MNFEYLLVDLDETVYPTSNGLWEEIGNRINLYLLEKMKFPAEEISTTRLRLYREYGTTLRGLMELYGIDQEEYLNFVHNIDLDLYLHPSPEIKKILDGYSLRKFIFTNADRNHAIRVLKKLEILDCFEGIIDIFDLTPYCKPQLEAYHIAMGIIGTDDPGKCVMVDDRYKNVDAARQVGISTIMVGNRDLDLNQHPRIAHLADLPSVLPYNWTGATLA